MTKQHFIAFAAEIRQSDRSAEEKAAMYYLVVRVARQFNSRFDAERFRVACGLQELA
jgi:hypothetical protein